MEQKRSKPTMREFIDLIGEQGTKYYVVQFFGFLLFAYSVYAILPIFLHILILIGFGDWVEYGRTAYISLWEPLRKFIKFPCDILLLMIYFYLLRFLYCKGYILKKH